MQQNTCTDVTSDVCNINITFVHHFQRKVNYNVEWLFRHTADGTPWKKLEVKVCVVKCKTSIQTQTSSTIMTPTVGFLSYNMFRTNNSSLWFCLSPIAWIIYIKWCSLSLRKWVNRWTIIHRMGHNQSLLSYYTLDQQEPDCKTVSCPVVWHRLVNHHRDTNGSAKYHVPHRTFRLLHQIQL